MDNSIIEVSISASGANRGSEKHTDTSLIDVVEALENGGQNNKQLLKTNKLLPTLKPRK